MNRRALITGASSGIGRQFALALARQGYAVLAAARREDKLRELIAELPSVEGGAAHAHLVADLASPQGIAAAADALNREHYDLLVNNAGLSFFESFYESDLARQREIMSVNCQAVMELAHAFLRQSRAGDALINVSSVVDYLPTPAQPMYSASKSFIASLSECLWDEHRARGVYVMGLCPGITATEFIAKASGGEADGSSLPAAMTQSAAEVVDEALAALKARKKAIVITGRGNRLMAQLPRLLSRHRLIKIMSVLGDPTRAL